jgi:phospholipid transport system transporter-binding protein
VTSAAPALRIERVDATSVRVSGSVGFANAGDGVARSDEILGGESKALAIDLGGLSHVDSATLGVVLIWAARGALRGMKLTFANAPAGLRALATLCDAEPLLGWV